MILLGCSFRTLEPLTYGININHNSKQFVTYEDENGVTQYPRGATPLLVCCAANLWGRICTTEAKQGKQDEIGCCSTANACRVVGGLGLAP